MAGPRVSLTMIVKNEEHNLAACLGPVRGLIDEMIVVDTGSTDRTRDIARSFGANVSDFAWVDSFSAGRNAALDRATGDWAFWMDADDRLDEENSAKLAKLFASLTHDNAAYVMKCVCVADSVGGTTTAVDHVRLFRTDPRHRWKYRVHEQILPSLRLTATEVRWSDVAIRHVGYVDAPLRKRKLARDLRLLELEKQEQPNDPFTLFNLGSVYNELGDMPAAIAALEASLAGSHPKDSIVRKLYASWPSATGGSALPPRRSRPAAQDAKSIPDDAERRAIYAACSAAIVQRRSPRARVAEHAA